MKERIINIGPRLKQRRKEMRIKQTEMAKELGVSQTYLSNIEGGRTNCSITLFVDICNYLNVTPDYLMRFDLSRCFSAKHYISENSVQNIRRADNPQRLRIIGSKVLFYL